MTRKTRESTTTRSLLVGSTLTLVVALSPASSLAAEDFFPSKPLFTLPASLFGGETRVVAANPARAHYAAARAANIAPEGRLRLRPVAFRGL